MIDNFIEAVSSWCNHRKDIVGLALVGSYAKGSATEKSDVDLAIITEKPKSLLTDHSWIQQFGNTRTIVKESYGKVTSLRATYEHFPEVEFGITDLSWVQLPLDQGTKQVFLDGISIIYDPKELLEKAVISTR